MAGSDWPHKNNQNLVYVMKLKGNGKESMGDLLSR